MQMSDACSLAWFELSWRCHIISLIHNTLADIHDHLTCPHSYMLAPAYVYAGSDSAECPSCDIDHLNFPSPFWMSSCILMWNCKESYWQRKTMLMLLSCYYSSYQTNNLMLEMHKLAFLVLCNNYWGLKSTSKTRKDNQLPAGNLLCLSWDKFIAFWYDQSTVH